MKIAVPYEDGLVFQHFGHTGTVKLYETADGKVVHQELANTAGHGHGALVGFLTGKGVDALICGGIGAGAQEALAQAGITLYGGVTGGADDAVEALLAGHLSYDPAVHCDHHDHEGHDACGEDKHGCGGGCGH